jgi:type VI secretion system protein VasD
LAVLAFGLSLLGACGSDPPPPPPPPPPPTKIIGSAAAGANINPDINGRPSPVVLRLYELKSETAFTSSAFFPLYDNDQAILARDLQSREEILLTPGQTIKIDREFKAESRYLGVVAAFQAVDKATWRALAEIPANQTTNAEITVQGLVLKLATQPVPPPEPVPPADAKGGK